MKKYKRIIWIAGCLFFLWLGVHITTGLLFGDVNYAASFGTNYKSIKNDSLEITTSWGKIKTKEKLIHVATKPSCPGYVGSFIASRNIINYEYGMLSPDFKSFRESGFSLKTDTLNNRIIHTVTKGNLTGFTMELPGEDELWNNFVVYPTTYATSNKENLLNTLATIEFLK